MVKLDLARLTREELRSEVDKLCSRVGTVQEVFVVRAQKMTFAMVKMSSLPENSEVLRRFGDYKVDSMVLIEIEQP